jgi:acyl carrier protein
MDKIKLICEIFTVETNDFKLDQSLESVYFWDSVGKLQLTSYILNQFQIELSEDNFKNLLIV